MELTEVVEIALADVDRRRIEITTLEPADIARGAIGGVTQLVTELIDNALEFSGPGERVMITGVFDRDEYVISIADNGVGIPEPLLDALNRVLYDPELGQKDFGTSLGIVVVARLAARHGIDVRLVPSVSGTTARVTIPSRLVSTGGGAPVAPARSTGRFAWPDEAADEPVHPAGHVVAMTDSAREEAEALLEKVFGPLRGRSTTRGPVDASSSGGNGHIDLTSPNLQTRVPGENFAMEDDDPSVMSGEAAVDIRLNLSRYDEGRRQASEPGADEDE